MNEPSLDDINRFERKIYLVCLAGLAAGLILLAIVWAKNGWVSGILGAVGIILIILSLIMLGFFINFFYKMKVQMRGDASLEVPRETYITWPAWYTKWGRTVMLMVAIYGGYTLARMHENDFGGNRFVWHSLIGGLIAGLVIYNLIRLQKPGWTANPNMGTEIGLYIVIGCVYLFVVLGPLINKSFAQSAPICKEYVLLESGSKYINISNNGKSERFQPPPGLRKQLAGKKTVVLCTRKGYLGYDYVETFRLAGP